jgi:uncharacterized membrane protein
MSPSDKRNPFFQRISQWFVTGILVTAPLALTLSLVWLVIDFFDQGVDRLLPAGFQINRILPFYIPGFGLVIAGITLTIIGWFAAGFLGRWVVRFGEAIVIRMPIIRGVYSALKQIFETVLSKQSSAFRQVVLVQYPRQGCYTIGFVTAPTSGEVASVMEGIELISVYVPTTPNPSSGFLLFFPKEEVLPLNMSVEDAFKMVISLGIIPSPEKFVNQGK